MNEHSFIYYFFEIWGVIFLKEIMLKQYSNLKYVLVFINF